MFKLELLKAATLVITKDCCWFSHDVIKIQNLRIIPPLELRFHFYEVLEQLKPNIYTKLHFERALRFVILYASISQLSLDSAFTWRPRELSCRLK